MKNLKKYFILIMVMFLAFWTKTYAQELDIQVLGKLVLDEHPNISSFYVIGEYVFTSDFVGDSNLNTQDIMIASRSIKLEEASGELIKGTEKYNRMSIYTIRAVRNMDGEITSWKVGNNLIAGTYTITNDTKLDIKYIDYKSAKAVHTVTFKDEKDSLVETQYVIDQKKATSPALEEKTGYDFVGWFKCTSAENCSNVADSHDKFDLENTPITDDITLKAKWEIHKYSVTFEADGGTGDTQKQEIEYNNNASRPSEITKTGYDFKGWYKCLNDDCTSLATEEFNFESTKITEDVKLKAKWEIHKYSVTFDENGGNASVSEQTVEYNKTASEPKPDPKQDGYKFLGWYLCTSPSDCDNIDAEQNKYEFSTPVTKDIKLKAKWEEITYTVTFKGIIDGVDDDRFVNGKKTITVKYPYNIKSDQIPETSHEGYKFLGWFDSENHSIILNTEAYYVRESTEITGKWERETYTVTFKNDDKTDYRTINVKYGDSIDSYNTVLTHKNNDKYNNYVFQGWYKCLDDDCNNHEETPYNFETDGKKVTGNLTLIAVYKQIVNTSEIMSDFTSNLKSSDYSAYESENKTITFNILTKEGKLNENNFTTFLLAMKKIVNVKNVESVEIGYSSTPSVVLDKDSRTLESQLQTLVTTLSGKSSINEGTMLDLLDQTFTIKITINESFKNDEDKQDVTYTVKFASDNYVVVDSEATLRANLNAVKEIIIKNDFTIDNVIEIENDNVIIDGNGKKITSNIKDSKYAIKINGGNVTIKDLTLVIDVYLPSEYDKENSRVYRDDDRNTIGIYVGKSATLSISKLTVDGGKEVNKETLQIGSESYSSTNIAINVNAAIELHGTLTGSSLTYTTEIYGSPAILVARDSDAQVYVGGVHYQKYVNSIVRKNDRTFGNDTLKKVEGYDHYYTDYNSSYFTTTWYVMPNNERFSFFYLYNEHLILPEAFTQTGSKYNYSDGGKTYELKTWTIKNGREGITSEELTQVQVKSNNGYYIYGKYQQIA